MPKADPRKILISSVGEIERHLRIILENHVFHYRTLGSEIEVHIAEALVAIFTRAGFISSKEDYFVAPDKNTFPDFLLKKPILAIEFKTGNRKQLKRGRWIDVKNSENDMGTLNRWPTKIDKFGGDNIYYIFVTYVATTEQRPKIVDITIKPFFGFLAITQNNILKYREKDGNLRPKNFDAPSQIKSLQQFLDLIDPTNVYRSKRIIKSHLKRLRAILGRKFNLKILASELFSE